ncbi:MAG TPA: S41 family peptidase [Bryobacteraceae bacterium]|nr:S41 family peptidase [Bryobacteraceae bacterium]
MNSRFKLMVVTSSTALVVLLLLGAAAGRSASPDDAYRHLSVYTEVLSRIKSEYVEEPDIKKVTLGATNGLLEAMDPFASYLSSEQYKQYLRAQESRKTGVGLALSRKFGYVGVVNVVPGSAAWKAGLTTGDMLEAIGGVGTRDMPLAYAEMLLTGDPGTSVELSVLRVRKPEPQKITLTRAAVRYPDVSSRMLSDGIGLVQAVSLADGRVKDVAQHLEGLRKQGAKRYILDLRNSGFAKPEDGVALANLFLDKGLIAYTKGQKSARQDFNAEPARAQFRSEPLVILTNRGTANAAEVATAALLDNKRAEVVGEKTYGDAAIRRPITMDDGSAVLLAVAKYYSPAGKAIMDDNVTPSVTVTVMEPVADTEGDDATPAAAPEPKKDEDDVILKRGIEVLTKGNKAQANVAKESVAPAAAIPERQNPLRD